MADLTFESLTKFHAPISAAALLHKAAEWRRRRRQRQQLAQLSDRELQDIGVTRMEVEYELSKSYWQV